MHHDCGMFTMPKRDTPPTTLTLRDLKSYDCKCFQAVSHPHDDKSPRAGQGPDLVHSRDGPRPETGAFSHASPSYVDLRQLNPVGQAQRCQRTSAPSPLSNRESPPHVRVFPQETPGYRRRVQAVDEPDGRRPDGDFDGTRLRTRSHRCSSDAKTPAD